MPLSSLTAGWPAAALKAEMGVVVSVRAIFE